MIDTILCSPYCMNFSNEEITMHLLNRLTNQPGLNVGIAFETAGSEKRIGVVLLDGETENFFVRFYGHQISVFISDETPPPGRQWTVNEEIMVVDDEVRAEITSSDTSGNIVYEGSLRDKSHKEILELVYQVVLLLSNAVSIRVEAIPVGKAKWRDICSYIVHAKNSSAIKQECQLENIRFLVNG